jgi:uncharacterized protein YkwD
MNNKTLGLFLLILFAVFFAAYVLPNNPRSLGAYPKSKQCSILPINFDTTADGKLTISDLPGALKGIIRYPGRLTVLKLEPTPVGMFLEIKSVKCFSAAETVANIIFWNLIVLMILSAATIMKRIIFMTIYRLSRGRGVVPAAYDLPWCGRASLILTCTSMSLVVIWTVAPAFSSTAGSNRNPKSVDVVAKEGSKKISMRETENGSSDRANENSSINQPTLSESVEATAYIREVLRLTNKARSQPQNCGDTKFEPADNLEIDDKLMEAAKVHAQDMARNRYFSHISQDGRQLADRVNANAYSWRTIGENIAKGQRSSMQVVTDWVRSPGHCKNVMNAEFKHIGIARSGEYWVQVFGATR